MDREDRKEVLSRIESVDVFRVLAILAVIAIHTTPFGRKGQADVDLFSPAVQINQFAQFAVPFFFIISGYFWGEKVWRGSGVVDLSTARAKRIALLFAVWSVVYVFPFHLVWDIANFKYGVLGPIKGVYWNLINLGHQPADLLFRGTKIHLWFLFSLAWCILISALFISKSGQRPLMICAVLFFFFYILSGLTEKEVIQ